MTNEKSKKILEQDYAETLPEVVDYIVMHDSQADALALSRDLSRAIDDNIESLRQRPRFLAVYNEEIAKMRFICLPALDDNIVASLLKDDLSVALRLDGYDLSNKLKFKLLNIIAVADRNKMKEKLRKNILENSEVITPKHEIKTIKDWLKNYVAKVGLENIDSLVRAQYLSDLKNDKQISPREYDNLSMVFKLYDILNTPSDSPAGFEEEPAVMVGGKLYIFRKGVLEAVNDNKNLNLSEKLLGATTDAGNSADSHPASVAAVTTSDLESALNDYAPGSLEYKAIKQEISRLKAAELKQAQRAAARKSDVLE